ncbi:MAG TPA: DUF6335 family protein [Pyrinomonadaceae bacterium]|nr:hypothetical protein [Chloracidobacterium sp.]MBK7804055.1 hypothetical protein [Chloracidobacterium sp.]MBL0239433.1 hypothetical protein [Chloracidobacterium sp.]MBP9936667.1 hypothetical protein [Pyrinomonadaceae bacterium]HQY68007.1 DUF6335 family protein [Pyrinomonadaceae bacterium]
MNNQHPTDAELDQQVKEEFAEEGRVNEGSQEQLLEKLADYTDRSPKLSGGDIDAAWEDSDVGEESVGGGNPTPDQSVVEELGEAMGITYQDNEPLGTEKKLERRDEDRWELNPASAEDFGDNE